MAKTVTLEEQPAVGKGWQWNVLVVGLVLAAGLAAYCNCFGAPFILDDPDQIANNPSIRQLWPLPIDGGNLTRPVVYITLAINYAISEYQVWSYHILNLLVHLLAGLTLYGLVRRTLLSPKFGGRFEAHAPLLALAISLIWLVHPMLTSAVTYIIQRAESIMGLMFLLTLYCGVRARDSKEPFGWIILAGLCSVIGFGAKQIMVTAPLMLIAYDWAFSVHTPRQRRRLMLYFVLVALTAGLVIMKGPLARRMGLGEWDWIMYVVAALPATWLIVDALGGKLGEVFNLRICAYLAVMLGYVMLALTLSQTPMDDTAGFEMRDLSWHSYGLTQLYVHVKYMCLELVPYPLCLDYELATKSFAEVWPYAIIVAGLLVATAVALWKKPVLGFLGLWYFLILAPSSSVMPIKDKIFEFRVYLSIVAVIGLLVMGTYLLGGRLLARLKTDDEGLAARRHVQASAIASGLVGMLVLSVIWAGLWVYGMVPTLGAWTLICVAAGEAIIFYVIGLAVFRSLHAADDEAQGDEESSGHDSIGYPIGIGAGLCVVLVLTLVSILRNYDYRSEISIWEQTLSLRPDNPRAHSNMGVVLLLAAKTEPGLKHLHQSIECDPTFLDAIYNLGVMAGKMNQPYTALEYYRDCLKKDPRYMNARLNLAVALQDLNRQSDALAEYKAILEREPRHVGALTNAGVILFNRGELTESLKYLEKSVAVEPLNGYGWNNLIEVNKRLGRTDQAKAALDTLDRLRNPRMGRYEQGYRR